MLAAKIMSVIFPPVQEPMYARSSFTSRQLDAVSRLSGECGLATSGSSDERSHSASKMYFASGSSTGTSQSGRLERARTYWRVFSSTSQTPFLPPASMAMLVSVMRSSSVSDLTPSPAKYRTEEHTAELQSP